MSGGDDKDGGPDARVLDELFKVIAGRKGADPESSYTAKLFQDGLEAIADKVSEEAAETVEAARSDRPDLLAGESADLLYHLLVLWAARGVTPAQVWAVLEGRRGTSGLAEKAARGKEP
ncbi:MAG: phosphoribosyl-ATP diphosphatase [Proteobacteria bacterium]|nr:phosphoribosyl-ATP diphosphatase [Pseudomonadota bacterium]